MYRDPAEIEEKGLDFGICLIGEAFVRSFELTNDGEFEGVLSMTHPNERVTIEVDGENVGRIALQPQQTKVVNVIFRPDKRERLIEPISIPVEENPTLIVPVKGFAGFCSYELEGIVDFVNMMIEDRQVMTLKLKNTGDIRFPFSFWLEPPSLLELFEVNVKHSSSILEAETEPVEIEIIATPNMMGNYAGALHFKTDLGRGPVTREYPIRFFAYKDPVIISDETNHEFGRVCVGDSESFSRFLTNFAVHPHKFRFKVEVLQFEPDSSEYQSDSPASSARTTPHENKSRAGTAKRPKTAKPAAHPEAYRISPLEGMCMRVYDVMA